MKARQPSLVNPRDRTHRAALSAGYSWRTLELALASAAEPYATRALRQAETELAQTIADRCARLVDAWMPDAAIRCLADGRADYMGDLQAALSNATTTAELLAWLNRTIAALDARPFTFAGKWPEPDQLRGFLSRTRYLDDAFPAVNRSGDRRASWAQYVRAQGGLKTGRNYRLHVGTIPLELEGRYETQERHIPLAVFDIAAPEVWHLSSRQLWRPNGTWPRASASPVASPVPAQLLIQDGKFAANPAHAVWLATRRQAARASRRLLPLGLVSITVRRATRPSTLLFLNT